MIKIIISLIIVSTAVFSAVNVSLKSDPWVGLKFGNETGELTITNSTNSQVQIDGIRATFPNASIAGSGVTPLKEILSVSDGSGASRFDVVLSSGNGGTPNKNLPLNIFDPNRALSFDISTTSVDSGAIWTPTNFQVLIIGGKSLAEKKVNKDITGITITQLDSIMKTSAFYDANLFVLDTLGIHGSQWGAGFVDTWYDQEKDEPIWQIQVGKIPVIDSSVTPLDTFRVWNENKEFEPDSMDRRDSKYGKGPMFMMGAAMAQEYMNIDMQYLLGTGFQESQAGLNKWISSDVVVGNVDMPDTVHIAAGAWINAGKTVDGNIASQMNSGGDTTIIYLKSTWVKGWQELAFEKVNYYNHNTNGETTRGPMHFIESSYHSYVFEGYPKFFPYDNGVDPGSPTYVTCSTGGCEMNSPQIANAYLLSSLYMWYSWQLVVAKLGQDGLDFFRDASNREIAAQMVSWAWNKGTNGSFATFVASPDGNKQIDKDVDYVGYVWNGVNHLENANRNSTLAGGKFEVYDSKIGKRQFEDFFFGEGGVGSSGTLGTAGILHHFKLSDSKRQELWADVSTAFDMLKGKAPSTKGTDMVSFRYDYLAILRIAKSYLDLSLPVPKVEEFKNWTTETTASEPIDRISPFLPQGNKVAGSYDNGVFHAKFKVSDIANMVDSCGIRGVEWTMDSNWGSWMNANLISGTVGKGDKSESIFDIEADQKIINAIAPSSGDTVTAWVKVTDVNDNEVIDTFRVWYNSIGSIVHTPPVLDSSSAFDSDGDGLADNIVIYLRLEASSDAIDGMSGIQYSWPTKGNWQTPTKSISGNTVILKYGSMTGGYGEGDIKFSYPSKSGYTGIVFDRVGPAITVATKVKTVGVGKDTLKITLTEELKSTIESGNAKFKLHNGDNRPITADSAKVSGKELLLTFKSGTIVNGDSISIDASGSTEDLNGNRANNINQHIKIKVVAEQKPLFEKAEIFDKDGNGTADSIILTVTLGDAINKYITSQFTDFVLEWPRGNAISGTTTTTPAENKAIFTGFESKIPNGTGEISAKLPDGSLIKGDIVDKVGPVITEASRLVLGDASAKDTVKLIISESLNQKALDGGLPKFIIHNGTSTDVTALSVMYTGSELTVIFERGTVDIGDSISFNSSSTIFDDYGNPPAGNNQIIPLTILSQKSPTFSSSFIYDNNGDGFGDSLILNINLGSAVDHYTTSDLSNHKITWPSGFSPITSGNIKAIDDSTLQVTGFTAEAGYGDGSVTFTVKDGTSLTGNVTDKVGPTIESAVLFEKTSSSNNDTLRVKFNEPLENSFSDNSSYLIVGGLSVSSLKVIKESFDNTYTFVFTSGTVNLGDFVKIDNSSSLSDTYSNKAHSNNPKVVIRQLQRPLSLSGSGSYYYDDNSDGIVDRVRLHFGVKVNYDRVKDFLLSFYWPGRDGSAYKTTIKGKDFVVDNLDSTFISIKLPDISKYGEGVTSVLNDNAFLSQPNEVDGVRDSSSIIIADGMAPIITTAIYRGMNVDSDTVKVIDTLIIKFSEDVKSIGSEKHPFICKNSSGTEYKLMILLSSEGSSVTYTVEVSDSSTLPALGDSIWINANGSIKDADGNKQENENNRGTIFSEALFRANYDILIYPNPMARDLEEKNEVIEKYSEGHMDNIGVIAIMAKPFGNRPAKELLGEVSLYDQLGSRVLDSKKMKFQNRSGVLLIAIRPSNLKGRKLASGTYLAVINITGADGVETQITRMIGIKK